ncbi:hypothetical protein LSAT2_002740 [Lamellibrachia satsuma]|nr:hypothetical protein LSAT2_002740 [Lamellibrachia satsuma]
MATMQQLLVWLKDLSSRRGKDDSDWFNPCRASMKLPPIPKQFESRYPDVSRYFTDSPAHIYEEIPPKEEDRRKREVNANSGDLSGDKPSGKDSNGSHDVDIDNLAFDQAKTFGSYLVVPMKDRLTGTGGAESHVPADHRLSVAATVERPVHPGTTMNRPGHTGGRTDCLDDSCCSRKTSSSDSGVSVENSLDGAHVHCTRCCRPHGMYDGVPFTHHDGEVVERDFARPPRSANTATVRPTLPYRDLLQQHFAVDGDATCSYHRDHVTDESTDSYNDFDFRCGVSVNASPRTRRGQPDMTSTESDGGSSIYPASLSDGDRAGGIHIVTSGSRCGGNNSSDSSNDTYSEYDVRSDDSLFRQPSDYDYFLSRVRHNLTLEAEVQRHIRLSESSDYETNSSAISGDGNDTSDDIVSLTSITSLSGISITDERESRRAPPHTDVANKTRRRSHTAKSEAPPRGRPSVASDAPKQRKTKTVSFADARKTRRTKPVEYYRLPDFPHKAATASAEESDDLDMSEKLSCRATNFQPAGKPVTRKPHDRSENVHSRTATHAKHPPNSQNRLLTDLMRMNHDRQLLVLF